MGPNEHRDRDSGYGLIRWSQEHAQNPMTPMIKLRLGASWLVRQGNSHPLDLHSGPPNCQNLAMAPFLIMVQKPNGMDNVSKPRASTGSTSKSRSTSLLRTFGSLVRGRPRLTSLFLLTAATIHTLLSVQWQLLPNISRVDVFSQKRGTSTLMALPGTSKVDSLCSPC